MIYDVKLRIAYDYMRPATGGRHIVCVTPLDAPGVQRVVAVLLEISPKPDERTDRHDFFGNRLVEFAVRAPHNGIRVTLQSRIERLEQGHLPAGASRLRDLAGQLSRCTDMGPDSPLHFLSPSFRVPRNSAMTRLARTHSRPDMSLTDVVQAVGQALHAHMRFDSSATTVDTPAAEAFSRRSGVCQDFSHIMIACLRGIGVPSGYVSGFLRTLPPKGKPRLEGADAMHAWVRAWCGPVAGWMEFDPTNNMLAGPDHIVVARGRDYSDVAPIKGMLRSEGSQKNTQAVDVISIAS